MSLQERQGPELKQTRFSRADIRSPNKDISRPLQRHGSGRGGRAGRAGTSVQPHALLTLGLSLVPNPWEPLSERAPLSQLLLENQGYVCFSLMFLPGMKTSGSSGPSCSGRLDREGGLEEVGEV